MALLNSIGLSILAFVFVLGVMIFIHELGHYLVAKLQGIRVEVFSLGFGRRLFGFQRGETDYRISLLPLGGYVKMAGENYDEDLTGSPDEFLSRPKYQRFLVAIAGPAMNLGLALGLVMVVFVVGTPVARYAQEAAVIGEIQENSPAAQAGLQIGDKIVSIDGSSTPTWRDVEIIIATSPNQRLVLSVERDGQIVQEEVTATVLDQQEIGTIGVSPFVPYKIEEIEDGSPADQAGLEPGDEIVEVSYQGKTARGFLLSAELISSSQGEPLHFLVRRGDQTFEKTIAPVQMDGNYRIGTRTAFPPTVIEKYGPWEAFEKSIERNFRLTMITFDILGRIVTGRMSLRAMSGPIEIARFSGVAAAAGIVQLLNFMAFVSLQLGILNLMPIPILDGGVIALLAVEGLRGRDLSMRVKERIFQAGFLFLILLMGIVIFNDIVKNLPILD